MQPTSLKNKKIICTVTNDLFRDGRMIRICNALAEYGAQVCLTGVEKSGSLPLKKQKFEQKRMRLFFKKGMLFYMEYNLRLFFYLMKKDFDTVNSVDTDTVLAGFLAALLKRKKIVFDAHEYFTGVPELKGRVIKRKIWSLLEKIFLPRIKSNYTVSESLKSLYEAKTGRKYGVIRNFPSASGYGISRIPKDLPCPESIQGKELIVYAGVLNAGRGLESSIEMMKYFDDKKHLLIVGGGDLEAELKRLAETYGVQNKVTFTGWVDAACIPSLIKGASIGLNLLDGDSVNYRVSLANKVFDYMHSGIPCLTMDFGEYRKIQDEYGCFILTDTLQPEELYHKIKSVLEGKNKFAELKANALKAAKDMVWEREKEKLLRYYS